MSFKAFLRKHYIFLFIFCLAIITRFYKLDWGNGYFFNPDENNMGSAIARFNRNNFNPDFYAYGQFPLYLAYFSQIIKNFILTGRQTFQVSFGDAVLALRFWSATFSIASFTIAYLIGQKIFKNKLHNYIFLLLFVFNPGLIQMSHFGTTESILLFVFIFNIYISQKYLEEQKIKYLVFAAIISGVGLGSKISALILTGPVFLALLIDFFKKRNYLKTFYSGVIFLSLSFLISLSVSPFNFFDINSFRSSMSYETGVATGKIKVFYTHQFLHSIPYLFQLQKIFPYTNGLPVFFLSILGILIFIKKKQIKNMNWTLIVVPAIIYFLYTGQLFVKWTRFMSPIFFIFPLFTAYFISTFKKKRYIALMLIISVLPGAFFLNTYIQSDTRIRATQWIENNIPYNSKILSEAGNVFSLPVTNEPYLVNNYDFYNLDKDIKLINELPQTLAESEYIIIPSRRIFKNQFGSEFPFSDRYYKNLFSGRLGFTKLTTITPLTEIILNSENAEETWSVFDRPTIRIYKKTANLKLPDYEVLLNQ